MVSVPWIYRDNGDSSSLDKTIHAVTFLRRKGYTSSGKRTTIRLGLEFWRSIIKFSLISGNHYFNNYNYNDLSLVDDPYKCQLLILGLILLHGFMFLFAILLIYATFKVYTS